MIEFGNDGILTRIRYNILICLRHRMILFDIFLCDFFQCEGKNDIITTYKSFNSGILSNAACVLGVKGGADEDLCDPLFCFSNDENSSSDVIVE